MSLRYLLALAFMTSCVSRPRVAPGISTPELPEASCVPVTDCRVVARHRLDSRFARDHGFYESPSGLVASRQRDWQPHGHREDTFFVEVTESCEAEAGYYIESEARVWLPVAASCRLDVCSGPADYDYALEEIEGPHDAHRFRPLGHGFYDDGTHVFDRSEVLHVDDVDRTTFHACERPEDEEAWSFYPSAEDSRGVFGYGDCGDLARATR
jgi:hypothetical protein